MSKGQLFIVSGPSGSGKDTVLGRLFQRYPDIELSISSVTRPMRPGETEGEKYHFISKERFLHLRDSGELLESNEYLGNFYGTPRRPVEECLAAGRDMILEIDVNGAEKVRKLMPGAVSVFIMPPSLQVLERRLCGRKTEDLETVHGRLREALAEISRASGYDYIVVNDVLERAVDTLGAIILSERARAERNQYLIDEVLKDVESCNW